jgi:hypothetical protein
MKMAMGMENMASIMTITWIITMEITRRTIWWRIVLEMMRRVMMINTNENESESENENNSENENKSENALVIKG